MSNHKWNRSNLRGGVTFALGLLPIGLLFAIPHYPSPAGYVTDAANILDASSKSQLEIQLSEFERQTSIEIAVATVPSLEGEPIESYAVELFKQWGVGKKGKDNGVLLLVAPQERKVRIEVGYGLEPVLPDGLGGQIIREDITPHFREKRYGDGISAGVRAIQRAVQGQYTSTENRGSPLEPAVLFFSLILLFILLP